MTDIFNQLKVQKPLGDDGLVVFRREDFDALRYNYYCLRSETKKNPKTSEYLRGYYSGIFAVLSDICSKWAMPEPSKNEIEGKEEII